MATPIRPRASVGDHLYAIVEGLPRRWRPPAGVDAAPVTARQIREVTVLTSAAEQAPAPTPNALAAHQHVLSTTLAAEAVLPLAFGTVLPPQEIDPWIASHLGLIRAHLAKFRRHVEMTVRIVSLTTRAEPALLRATAERLVERAAAPEWRWQDDGMQGLSSSLAFLVPRDGVGEFLARVAPVAARAEAVAVVPSGPSVPWAFSPQLPLPPRDAGVDFARAG